MRNTRPVECFLKECHPCRGLKFFEYPFPRAPRQGRYGLGYNRLRLSFAPLGLFLAGYSEKN